MFTNISNIQNQKYYMWLALQQAKINIGNTNGNPSVGCVITLKNSVISAGHTGKNGRPHAEVNAIKYSNLNLKNSELYVTMEPCSHYGLTPPCTKSIIKSGIKKVFFSIDDPDFRSFNKAPKLLKSRGIKVNTDLLSKKIFRFYKSYYKFKSKKLPFVTSKIAVSKDFYTINRKNKWITNLYSRGRVHLIRSNHDCLLTSSKTIIKDNPRLNCRLNGLQDTSPARIILDKDLKVLTKSKVLQDAKKYSTIIFYNKENKKKINLLKKMKVKTIKIPLINNDLNLEKALHKAKKLGFSRILLECGVKLNSIFLKKNLIDEFKLFISSNNLKKNGDASFVKYFKLFLNKKPSKQEKINLFGDKLISYNLK